MDSRVADKLLLLPTSATYSHVCGYSGPVYKEPITGLCVVQKPNKLIAFETRKMWVLFTVKYILNNSNKTILDKVLNSL